MKLNYQTFYRKYGIRLLPNLINPLLTDLKFLDLPLDSIYHFLHVEGNALGPSPNEYLFRNHKNPIPIESVIDFYTPVGNPRRVGTNPLSLTRQYLHTNRRVKIMRNFGTVVRDRNTPILYNYALLEHCYKYQKNFFTRYYKWENVMRTFCHKVAEISEHCNREHFIVSHSPLLIPSYSQLSIAAKDIHHANESFNNTTFSVSLEEITTSNMKIFKDNSSFLLLELFKWFSDYRETSIFNSIPKNKIHLVNIIFQESNKWCVLNLGILNSFYKNPKEAKDDTDYVIHSKQKIDGKQIQKRLIRFMLVLMEQRTITAKTESANTENTDTNTDGKIITEDDVNKDTVINNDVNNTDDPDNDEDDDLPSNEPVIQTTITDYKEPYKESIADANFINENDTPDTVLVTEMTEEQFNEHIRKEDELLDEELRKLDEITNNLNDNDNDNYDLSELTKSKVEEKPEEGISKVLTKLSADGLISPKEYTKFEKLANSYKSIKSVNGVDTLETFLPIHPDTLKIERTNPLPEPTGIIDKTMANSSLSHFDSKYVNHVLHKDYANAVMSVQKVGIAVTDYKVEKVTDILGSYEAHSIKISPIEGQTTTWSIKVPTVHPDGTFVANNVKYKLRKQFADLPIRKIAPDKVAITSYYGKAFILRGRKNADNYNHWLTSQVTAKALNKSDQDITNIVFNNSFDHKLIAPRAYTAISTIAKSFIVKEYLLNFDRGDVLKEIPSEILKSIEVNNHLFLGKSLTSEVYLFLDTFGNVYKKENNIITPISQLEEFIGVDIFTAPVEYANCSVYGKPIPVVILLGIELGLDKLMKLLKVNPKRLETGTKIKLLPDEYSIVFNDETLVFNRENKLASMILGGFNEYHRALKLFSVQSFNKKGVYVNLLETDGLGVRYVREMELMDRLFVDPITRDILIAMNEPTDFQGLLFKACQMLLTDHHPLEFDPKYMRIRGYERFAGAIYNEMVQAIREHNGKLGKANSKVNMNPYAVWKRISEDPSKIQATELNPIASLKEEEAVTYNGVGGRTNTSMVKHSRAYHKNSIGTISEATTDNSDVGINVYTSADPHFTSLRGITEQADLKNPNYTSILSTSTLLAPSSDIDDGKRVNFVNIQQTHAIAAEGYHQSMVRTGYEATVAHRTGNMFAVTAKKKGIVKKLSKDGIIIDYEDGTTEGYTIGREFGSSQGLTVAHEIITKLKINDKIDIGDPIVYNTGFFEPDFFNPKQIVWKNSINARTALLESNQTLEDSSAVSSKLSSKLTSKIAKVKTILVNFDEVIDELVQVGNKLEPDDVLCIIQNAVTANSKLFNAESIKTLKTLNANSPKANVKGIVERIEVFYNGDIEDMSESLQAIARAGDSELKSRAHNQNKEVYTGKVDSGFRIEGNGLLTDQMAIRIYITSNVNYNVADKAVFCNQLKSCTAEVLEKDITTEDGKIVDAIFGYRSIEARIVNSPIVMGTTASLLRMFGKMAVDVYRGK